ncbi:hypothetical protein ACFOLC_14920 [Lysobacter cavernae]|uniref:UrcA family protein n=1 Tax=Lysobacter cavernae TaxID=1685901 RepID=A0ABV7RSF0_9GAMM
MNLPIALLALAVAWPAAVAGSQPQPEKLVLDCDRVALPSQQAVARLTGIDNIGQAYAARADLMAQGQRACQREGVAQVRLLWNPTGQVDVGRPEPRVSGL